jgi:DNA-directed RNA polymerase beta subunit
VGARRKEAARPERRERPELPPLPGGRGQAMAAEKAGIVLEQLSRMELDPEISSRNLGRDHANFGPDAIVDTTSKLLAINRGEIDVDDRDDKANQTVHTVDDFMEERVQKDAGQIARTLLYRSRYNGSLKALKPGHFTPQLESLIVGNGLSQVAGGVNPLDLWDARFRITQVGEGGIGSADSIPVDARNVHPSQLGMIDVIRTPESGSVGIDQRIVSSARKGPNHQLFMPLVDKRTGKRVWRTPSQIYGKRVLFPRFKT